MDLERLSDQGLEAAFLDAASKLDAEQIEAVTTVLRGISRGPSNEESPLLPLAARE